MTLITISSLKGGETCSQHKRLECHFRASEGSSKKVHF